MSELLLLLNRYDVFAVESPNVLYSIKVSLLSLEAIKMGEADEEVTYAWKLISNFTLSPDKTSGRSPDGRV